MEAGPALMCSDGNSQPPKGRCYEALVSELYFIGGVVLSN